MKVLLVDRTLEGQAVLAKRIESFDDADHERFDLTVNLSSEEEHAARLLDTDLLILGSALGDEARAIARAAKAACPTLEVLMFVPHNAYGGGMFRSAYVAGVRKVFPDTASSVDLLQELTSIHEELRQRGKLKNGRLIVVTQAKGGVGATTICAALGEVCSDHGQKTLLWDFDIESRDLCRALTAKGQQSVIVSDWVQGKQDVTRQSLQEALFPLSDHVSLLMPPDLMAASMDLVGQADSITTISRVVDLARVSHDNIIVDASGRLSPATGALMLAADIVLVVIDDSVLGLTAVHSFMDEVRALLHDSDSVRFLCSGTGLAVDEIKANIEQHHRFAAKSWELPAVPFEPTAKVWPGTGKTLYSVARKSTQRAFVEIAAMLGLIDKSDNRLQTRRAQEDKRAEPGREPAFSPFRALLQRVSFVD